jgi:hypothetical protein
LTFSALIRLIPSEEKMVNSENWVASSVSLTDLHNSMKHIKWVHKYNI